MCLFNLIAVSTICLWSASIQAEITSENNQFFQKQEFNYTNTITKEKESLIEVDLEYFPKGSSQSIFHYQTISLPNELIKVVPENSKKPKTADIEDLSSYYYHQTYLIETKIVVPPNQKALFQGLTKANITDNNEISFKLRLHKEEHETPKKSEEETLVSLLNKDVFIDTILTPNTDSQIILSNEDRIIIHAKKYSGK